MTEKILIPKDELAEFKRICAKPTPELFKYIFEFFEETSYDIESANYIEAFKKRFGFKYRIPQSDVMQEFIDSGYVQDEGTKNLVEAKV